MQISRIKWDPEIYPRGKWNTSTVERYADAIEAGDEFPPVIVEAGTMKLLDGKHRIEAYKKAGVEDIPVEEREIPEGMTAKHYAAKLSSRHGDRMSNADLKALALEEFDPDLHADNPDWTMPDPKEWGKEFGVSKSTVYEWVSHFINRARADRQTKAWRLTQLGWTHPEIASHLDSSRQTIDNDANNSEIGKIGMSLGPNWNDRGVAEWANRMNIPLRDAMASAMSGMGDIERLKKLGIKIQPYDVWNFAGCHDLMGDKHPGRIPGELVTHVMYFYTEQGDLVIDPMAGSGTTLDAALLMGRKARGYDIDHRHERIDIEKHDLSEGWPDTVSKAKLIFWDPPYYDKMDSGTIGEDGYIEGSISGMSPDEYVAWISARFAELIESVKSGTRIAFLMSDWDPENAKRHADHPGIYQWDYAGEMQNAGWQITRQIQCPLGTQQVHPDIVNKFRESKRLARLGRYLFIGVKP